MIPQFIRASEIDLWSGRLYDEKHVGVAQEKPRGIARRFWNWLV
jgi:hypothetical protein